MKQLNRYIFTWEVQHKNLRAVPSANGAMFNWHFDKEFCFVDAYTTAQAKEILNRHNPNHNSFYQPSRHMFRINCRKDDGIISSKLVNNFNAISNPYDTMKRIVVLIGLNAEDIDYISKEE